MYNLCITTTDIKIFTVTYYYHLLLYLQSLSMVPIISLKAKESSSESSIAGNIVKSPHTLLHSRAVSLFNLCVWDYWRLQASYFAKGLSVGVCFLLSRTRFRLCISGRNITEVTLYSSHCIYVSRPLWRIKLPQTLIVVNNKQSLARFLCIGWRSSLAG